MFLFSQQVPPTGDSTQPTSHTYQPSFCRSQGPHSYQKENGENTHLYGNGDDPDDSVTRTNCSVM